MALTPDGSKLYVANFGSIFEAGNTVSVIDVATDTLIKEVTVGIGPIAIAITPDGSKVYVANFGSRTSLGDTVSVIDVATDTVIDEVNVGAGPAGVAVTPDRSRVYVTNLGGIDGPPNSEAGNTVSVINVATNTVIDEITVGVGPLGIGITPDGSKAYVTNFGSITFPTASDPGDTLSVINVETNIVIGEIGVGFGPAGIAITPDNSKVFVSNLDSVNEVFGGLGALSDPGDTVSVIDAMANDVIATITVGNRPFGIAVTHDGTMTYVANYLSGTVSVINVSTNSVIATIPIIKLENELLAGKLEIE
jgi:YVTN family beta-propeller protein